MLHCIGRVQRWMVLFGLFAQSVWAQPDQPSMRLSLSQALRLARQRHVQVILAQERVQQALARFSQARATLLPQITSSASEIRQTKNLEAAGITLPGRAPLVGPFNAFDARLRLTQTLLDFSAIQQLRAASAGKAVSLAEAQQAQEDVLALIATLYLGAQRAAQQLEFAQARLQLDEERLRLAKTQLGVGTGSALVYQQAASEAATGREQWQQAVATAVERRLDLTAALGIPPEQPIVLTETDQSWDASMPTAQDLTTALQHHPQLIVAQRLVEQQRATRAATEAEFFPTVSAMADYGASGKRPDDAQGTYTYGAQVSMPLFEGGLRVARVREASSQVRASEAQFHDTQRHIEAAILAAAQSVTRARSLLDASEAQLVAAIHEAVLAHQREVVGTGSPIETVTADVGAAQARDQHDEATATYRLAQVNLAHALGQTDEWVSTLSEHP